MLVNSEQVSLESFEEAGERLSDVGREFIPPLQNRVVTLMINACFAQFSLFSVFLFWVQMQRC